MRSISRVTPLLESTVRSAVVHPAQRPFVCWSCQQKRRTRPAIQSRAVSSTTVRRADAESAADESRTFEPASTWEGLEWIGSKSWLYARDTQQVDHERWGTTNQRAASDADLLSLALRRSIVESLVFREAAVNSAERQRILEETKDRELPLEGVRISVSTDSRGAQLVYRDPDTKKSLFAEMGVQEAPETAAPTQGKIMHWTNVPFPSDPAEKFAIIKRVAQLTGDSLPDTVISGSATPAQVFAKLKKLPQPQTVLEALSTDTRLQELDNVTVYAKRQTYVDEDRAKGRWKVIEEELLERGLPLPKGVARSRRARERRKLLLEEELDL